MPRLVVLVLIFVGLLYFFFIREEPSPAPASPPTSPTISVPPEIEKTPSQETLGDEVLVEYASPTSTMRDDLRLFHNFVGNVFLLVKNRDPRHYATNEDLAEFLLGKNNNQEAYLSATHRIFNAKKQLADRHGIPLIIHPQSRDHLEIRSAGPDKKNYTEDDLIWPPLKPGR